MVPSSPFLPCSAGKITSKGRISPFPSLSSTSPWTEGSGERKAGVTGPCSQAPVTMSYTSPVQRRQFPSLVMPTMCTSYLSGERFSKMDVADIRETSCSEDTPPKITAMLSLLFVSFIAITPHYSTIEICRQKVLLKNLRSDFYYTMPAGISQLFSPVSPGGRKKR